jgi:hypothetical protein
LFGSGGPLCPSSPNASEMFLRTTYNVLQDYEPNFTRLHALFHRTAHKFSQDCIPYARDPAVHPERIDTDGLEHACSQALCLRGSSRHSIISIHTKALAFAQRLIWLATPGASLLALNNLQSMQGRAPLIAIDTLPCMQGLF